MSFYERKGELSVIVHEEGEPQERRDSRSKKPNFVGWKIFCLNSDSLCTRNYSYGIGREEVVFESLDYVQI